MYIVYIQPDLTLFWPAWPIIDLWWLFLTWFDFSGEPPVPFYSNKLYLLYNLSHNNFPWLDHGTDFFRFTNRDRAKNYGPFPNFGFYHMIIYPLIYPQKHPEDTQPFKKKSSAKLLWMSPLWSGCFPDRSDHLVGGSHHLGQWNPGDNSNGW